MDCMGLFKDVQWLIYNYSNLQQTTMKTRPQQLFPITIPMTFHRTHSKILRALKTPTTYVSRSKAWITMFNCVTEWYEYASVLFLGECGWRSGIAQERVTFVLIPKYFSRLCIYGRCLLHSFTCFPFADEDTVIDDAVYQSLGWFHLDWIWLLSPPPIRLLGLLTPHWTSSRLEVC